MKKFLLAASMLTALALPAQATVVLSTQLSGTGDNVVFNSVVGDLATATLNGPHLDIVQFRDLTGSTTFTASANGNDIKLSGSNNLFIQVLDSSTFAILGVTTEVFSLNGTGDATAFVQANDEFGNPEAIKTFSLGTLDPNKPSNFTFSALLGEVITSLRILDLNGSITSFEHYRIDVVPLAAVPLPPALALFAAGLVGLGWLGKKKHKANVQQAA